MDSAATPGPRRGMLPGDHEYAKDWTQQFAPAWEKAVLAAVRFVGDDDDVAPVREHRVPVTPLFRKELLNRAEHHAAGGDCELGPQVGSVGGLHRRLAQQVAEASVPLVARDEPQT